MDPKYVTDNAPKFRYLYRLQFSGITNMFGAAPYLQQSMGLSKEEAKTILLYWMENYEAIAQQLGIEV